MTEAFLPGESGIEKSFDRGGRCVLSFNGPLTIATVKASWLVLRPLLGAYTMVVLDLKNVSECDTAGFQLLAILKKNARLMGTKLKLLNHSPPVIDLIEIYGSAGLFRDKIVLPRGLKNTRRFRYGVQPQEY